MRVTSTQSGALGDLSVDIANLHREETFTDLRAASVRRLTPVGRDGSVDGTRPVVFLGETTLMTQVGPLPVHFEIDASTLEEAFERFPDGVKVALERLNERASEMAREESSRIVVPSGMPPGMPGAGSGPVGGKIIR